MGKATDGTTVIHSTLDYAKAQDGGFFLYLDGKYAGELAAYSEQLAIDLCNAYNNTYGRGITPAVIDEMYVALKQARDDLSFALTEASKLGDVVDRMQSKINEIINQP